MLSTTHRFLDGTYSVRKVSNLKSKKITNKKFYDLSDSNLNLLLYSPTHINHPSTVWARESSFNYKWLHDHTLALCKEYTYRYKKVHKCERTGLMAALATIPSNISHTEFIQPPQAMPDQYKDECSVKAYRLYYKNEKSKIAKYKEREMPSWMI